jgi:aminoglycoside/choline kinase family phosphotransferase
MAMAAWLSERAKDHGLLPNTLRIASADASFRRYLRLDTVQGGSRIVMDAPPDKENSEPFVRIAGLMKTAGLNAPDVLDWHEAHGFMLFSKVGPSVNITSNTSSP